MKRTPSTTDRSSFERLRSYPWARLVRGGPWLAAVALALGVLLVPSVAAAAGTITLHNPAPDEVDGRWKLKFTINYGSMPKMEHVPMVFSFQHVVKYEWAYTEQSPDKPVFSTKPLVNQPEINVPIDVGFADASGKLFKITKMDVPIRRDPDMGFEAGEYKLTVRESGRVFGRPMTVKLKGENKPIDRRPITFQDKPVGPKKPKKTTPGTSSADADSDPLKARDQGDVMVDESELEGVETDEPAGPPAEKPRQGGCGCRLAGVAAPASQSGLAALSGLGLVAAVVRRRRRRGARQ